MPPLCKTDFALLKRSLLCLTRAVVSLKRAAGKPVLHTGKRPGKTNASRGLNRNWVPRVVKLGLRLHGRKLRLLTIFLLRGLDFFYRSGLPWPCRESCEILRSLHHGQSPLNAAKTRTCERQGQALVLVCHVQAPALVTSLI